MTATKPCFFPKKEEKAVCRFFVSVSNVSSGVRCRAFVLVAALVLGVMSSGSDGGGSFPPWAKRANTEETQPLLDQSAVLSHGTPSLSNATPFGTSQHDSRPFGVGTLQMI